MKINAFKLKKKEWQAVQPSHSSICNILNSYFWFSVHVVVYIRKNKD